MKSSNKQTRPLNLKLLWSLHTPSQKKQGVLALFLSIIAAFTEALGIGLVLPIVTILVDMQLLMQYPLFIDLWQYLGKPEHTQVIIYSLSLLAFVYIFKATVLGLMSWVQADYINNFRAYLSESLYQKYLSQNYEFYLYHSSNLLIRNITIELPSLLGGVFMPLITIFTESLVVLVIITVLLIVQPTGTLILFCLFIGFSLLYYYGTKNYLTRLGQIRQNQEGKILRLIQEGLGAIKDLKLMGREHSYIERFYIENQKLSHCYKRDLLFSQFPRLWNETIAVLCFALFIVLVTFLQLIDKQFLLPLVAFIAIAMVRLLPSVNRLLTAYQSLSFADAIIQLVHNEFNKTQISLKPKQSTHPISFNNTINFQKVSFAYPNTTSNTLQNIYLQLKHNQCIGVLGESGAGKSTLIDLFLGLLTPTQGKILVDGIDIQENMQAWQAHIGYVPQHIFLSNASIKENIAFGIIEEKIDDQALKQAINIANLTSFIDSLPEGVATFVGERGIRLSGGQQQRIGIARALYHNPSVLVFDEATSALDSQTEAKVMAEITALKGKTTMVIIAHRLTTLKNCDAIYQISNGQLFETTLEQT